MKTLLLAAIRAYQRHLSPRKGYGCAYRIHTGHCSCSNLGFRAVRRYGVWQGLAVLQRRLHLCGVAHRRYSPRPALSRGHAQRGFCDAGCDAPGCDLPSCDLPCHGDGCNHLPRLQCEGCLDACDCCSGCDWPTRKKDEEEKWIHIPPQRRRD